MKTQFLLQLILLFFIGHATWAQTGQQTAKNDKGYYWEYLPPGYDNSGAKKYPVIISLHGCGEKAFLGNSCGNKNPFTGDPYVELEKLRKDRTGLPDEIQRRISQGKSMCFTNPVTNVDECFITISPQLNNGFFGVNWDQAKIHEFIEAIKDMYPVDTNRVYLTGLSLGGIATWYYAQRHPDNLAAIVPISGFGDKNIDPCVLKKLPIWAFHDDADSIVGAKGETGTINMETFINACDEKDIRVTLYQYRTSSNGLDYRHNAWIYAYSENPSPADVGTTFKVKETYNGQLSPVPTGYQIYHWLLAQRRTPVSPQPDKILPGKIEAEFFNAASEVTVQYTADGGGNKRMVGYINTSDYLDYNINVQVAGTYYMTFRVARGDTGTATFDIRKGSSVLNTVTVPPTGTWQTFESVTVPVLLSAGSQTLRLLATNGNWNINWLEAANHTLPGKIEAEGFTSASDVTVLYTEDGGGTKRKVGNISKDDYLNYYIYVSTSGTYNITFRVSSEATGSASFVVKTGDAVLNTVTVASTGNWQTFRDVTVPVSLSKGMQTVTLLALDGNWDINWMQGALPTTARFLDAEEPKENRMLIYPNPANSKLNVVFEAERTGRARVRLANAFGVFTGQEAFVNTGENHLELNVDRLSAGTYILEIEHGNRSITRQKVMVVD